MNDHYLFDVDGTLTEPRQRMSKFFAKLFLPWMIDRSVFLVAGSDREKVNEQVPQEVINLCSGVFCCMGNELWINDELKYKNEFNPPKALIEMLSSFQINTNSPTLGKAPFFEYRTGMLNFTTIGRNVGVEQRNIYYQWDKKSKERSRIAKKVEQSFPNLEAKVGGQISIDIQPKGYNKSQASKWIRENLGGEMHFFGDRCDKGGNDYGIYLDIEENGDGSTYKVESPEETLRVIGA
tara:strand:+ start:2403 stop:3113 length:711 start_codon:yes stop_codon:yes gene_type:complete